MSEVYNLETPNYYVVAVAKEEDDNTDLTYLKNKNTCHTGINMAAGWIYPLAHLISNSLIRGYGCDATRAAAEYFSKSCVPGALSTEYNTGEMMYYFKLLTKKKNSKLYILINLKITKT